MKRKKVLCLLTVLSALISFPLFAHGEIYVVSNTHPAGNDKNTGSYEKPLKTIQEAANRTQPGDTVIVQAGIYRENVRLRNSGTRKSPITFIAETPGSVILTGTDVIIGWERVSPQIPIYAVSWPCRFVIDSLPDGTPIENHPREEKRWGRAEQVIADGLQLLPEQNLECLMKAWIEHQAAIEQRKPSPVLTCPVANLGGPFSGMFAVDTNQKKLYLWLTDGSDPNKRRIEAATRSQIFGVNPWESVEGIQNICIRDFIFRYGSSFPQRPAVWLHGRNNLVEDCLVEDMSGNGISVSGTMRRCIVRRCGHNGGGAGGDGFVNEYCLWEGNSWKPIIRAWDSAGFKITWVNGGLFRKCIFRRNGGCGLWLDIHVRNVTITECLFQENEGTGLFIEISRDISAIRNLFVRNGVGIIGKGENWGDSGILIAESQNCTVLFNTCMGNRDGIALREQGPRLLQTPDYGEMKYHNANNKIPENICAFNQGYQLAFWWDNAFFGRHPADMEKFKTEDEFKENLKKGLLPEWVVSYDPREQEMTIDKNLYHAEPGQHLILYGCPWRLDHKVFERLEDFVSNTGFDAHSRSFLPGFVNVASDDYRLKPKNPSLEEAGWVNVPGNIKVWIEFQPWMLP